MLTLPELKLRVAAFSDLLPRTDALEKRIKIGVGFHNKWYRSQHEHWLGWIVVHEYKAQKRGGTPDSMSAEKLWSGLHCIPMMFWLAEAAGMEQSVLDAAELAAIAATKSKDRRKDCPQNGGAMRAVLTWVDVEKRLLAASTVSAKKADQAADEAFEHLASQKSEYRRLRNDVGPLKRHKEKGT